MDGWNDETAKIYQGTATEIFKRHLNFFLAPRKNNYHGEISLLHVVFSPCINEIVSINEHLAGVLLKAMDKANREETLFFMHLQKK